MPIVIETSHEFAERHSAKGQPVAVNGRLLFSDGATCSLGSADVRNEPPENDFQRLTLQQNYWREKLSAAATDFNQLKWALTGRGAMHVSQFRTGGVPRHDETGLEALRFLKSKVQECRAKLAEIDRELSQTFEFQKNQHREKVREEIAEIKERRDAEIRAEAAAITLD